MSMSLRPKIMAFAHGGSGNRGCEALLRSTAQMLHNEFTDMDLTVASFRPEEDIKMNIPFVSQYVEHQIQKRYTPGWFLQGIARNIFKSTEIANDISSRGVVNPVKKFSKDVDVCLSIGGDNYCYDYSFWLYRMNKAIKKNNKKLVLWGASIEENLLDVQMKEDMQRFDKIIVREPISFTTLTQSGIWENVMQIPDSAFTMEKKNIVLPIDIEESDTIGINISPLLMNYERTNGIALKSTCELVKHILNTWKCNILLVPHVVWSFSNDMEPLSRIYKMFEDTKRVFLIDPNYSAQELKGVISQCRLFIGARTHATIAAYSTCVPTLAIGYSVKSRGIARDIFGDEKGLMISVNQLEDEKQLIRVFEDFKEREEELKQHLQHTMPQYIDKAYSAAKEIRNML